MNNFKGMVGNPIFVYQYYATGYTDEQIKKASAMGLVVKGKNDIGSKAAFLLKSNKEFLSANLTDFQKLIFDKVSGNNIQLAVETKSNLKTIGRPFIREHTEAQIRNMQLDNYVEVQFLAMEWKDHLGIIIIIQKPVCVLKSRRP